MSDQADVRSIEALKDFRAVLALYAEEAQGALGAVKDGGPKRTLNWLHHDRKTLLDRAGQVAVSPVSRRGLEPRSEVSRRMHGSSTPEHTRWPSSEARKNCSAGPRPALRDAEIQGRADQEVGARPATGRHPRALR